MPRIVTPDELVALATRLQGECGAQPRRAPAGDDSLTQLDPFESPWKIVEASFESEKTSGEVDAPTVDTRPRLPLLTSIVSAGGQGYAVLDGKPLSVGASRDGYTLIELTDQAATVSVNGAIFTLPLHDKKNSP